MRGGGAPAHVVLVARVAYGLGFLAQKIEKAGVVLTEGSWWLELLRRVDVGEVRAADRGRARGGGCCRASPGLPIRQGDAQPCCEQEPGVRSIHGSTAVRNYGGGPNSLGRIAGRNPALARLGPGKASSTSLLGLRRSSGGGYWRPW